jgi:hypothetical protein
MRVLRPERDAYVPAMAIVPDEKDWTWVLSQRCPDCGHAAGEVPPAGVAAEVRATAARWQPLLAHPAVAVRPDPDTWSALEYACHVRDVFRLGDYRIGLMLREDEPTFPNWDQDASAIDDRYDEQDPALVGPELIATAEVFARLLEGVADAEWDRAGTRSDGTRFTAGTFAQYVLHDPIHHEWDVAQGYRALG